MAEVYSLVCWGGRTGKTVSISATTDVVTLTNHGLRDGAKLWPSGTLPAELSVLVPVYARSTAANTFTLHTSAADAMGNTGQILFAGSSTYSAVVLKSDLIASVSHSALTPYGLSDLSRWGASGSEFIYDSLYTCMLALLSRSTSSDDEVIEIGDAYDDKKSTVVNTGGASSQSITVTSRLNGYRTVAYHARKQGFGYVYESSTTQGGFAAASYNIDIDGLEFALNTSTSGAHATIYSGTLGFNITVRNCIVSARGASEFRGINIATGMNVYNNIVLDFKGTYGGIYISNGLGSVISHNLVTKCGTGFSGINQGYIYNNLSVGNTVNWASSPTFNTYRCAGNIGQDTDVIGFTAAVGTAVTAGSSATGLLAVNQMVFLKTTGTLPAVGGVPLSENSPVFIRSVSGTALTFAAEYNGGAMTFTDTGTGAHSINLVWANTSPPINNIDFTTPNNCFVDWAGGDYRPAGSGATPGSQAKQVGTGILFTGQTGVDMDGRLRPDYMNGGAEVNDVGPFEYDHGYGPRPASHVLTLDNVVVGSRVVIRDQAKTVVHFEQFAASSTVTATVTVYGDARDNWLIDIRQGSTYPYYQRYKTLMTATPGASSLFINQLPDQR